MAHILLVDDDAATLAVAAGALGADGHTTVTAGDGGEALERFDAGPTGFDVVVADVQMPGVDGIALAEALLASHPGLKVILMSALVGELARADQLKARGVLLLSKPYTLDTLRAAVRSIL